MTRNKLIGLTLLILSYAVQGYVTWDIYRKLDARFAFDLATFKHIGNLSDRCEMIERVVESHDEALQTLLEVKK